MRDSTSKRKNINKVVYQKAATIRQQDPRITQERLHLGESLPGD